MRKVIVLTPVKNEAHFLHRFLSVTSNFADHIILADQNSSDESCEIINTYPKAILINNQDFEIDNGKRQTLLINEARNRFGKENLLLALDVDEILSSNMLVSKEWRDAQNCPPGTVLYFEKPDLYNGTSQCIRYPKPWPLGFIDDGTEHTPTREHSIRIPTPTNHKPFIMSEIKVLHYALTRLDAQYSKVRLYSVRENLSGNWNILQRRRMYSQTRDYSNSGKLEPTKPEWFEVWEKLGIDMHFVAKEEVYWYDYEVLKMIIQFGEKRFYWDDIWNYDWETLREKLASEGEKYLQKGKIKKPNIFQQTLMRIIDQIDQIILKLKHVLKQ